MARLKLKKVKAILKKEYHLPMPDNKVGRFLSRRVKGPKVWQKFIAYLGDSRREMKKVVWPNRKESIRLTFAVFVFAAFFMVFTVSLDFGFKELVKILFL